MAHRLPNLVEYASVESMNIFMEEFNFASMTFRGLPFESRDVIDLVEGAQVLRVD
jgi:hypothetical protein